MATSIQLTFTIRNVGTDALSGLAASIVGTHSGDFAAGTIATTTLTAGNATTLIVTFTPSAIGTRSAVLRIASNDRNENPFDIAMTGGGGEPDIAVELSGRELSDGSSTVDFSDLLSGGAGSASLSLTIRNSGTALLTGLAASLDGAHPTDFSVGSFAATTLDEGESTTLGLNFTPTGIGAWTADLHIDSDDPDESPFDLTLSGALLTVTSLYGWAASFGLTGNDALPGADGDNDFISLLEEYAFNLDPTVFDQGYLVPGSGTSGLPVIRLVDDRLQVEYIRRRNDPNLVYHVEFGSTLPGGFEAATESETVTHVNHNFDRVIINDSRTTTTDDARFGRVRLAYPSP